jgi:hypothetical protein
MRTKAYRTIISLGLFLALGASAQAQTGRTVTAVPFDFYAGSTQLPAGTYIVSPVSQVALSLRNAGTGASILIRAVLPAEARQARDYTRLVFRRHGEQYFLAEVWSQADDGCRLYVSDRERKLVNELKRGKKSTARPLTVEVAALAKR